MDKTRNKIFVGCLALLLVMVAGYALFSQNLNIMGTATAKGDFSITPTCEKGIPTNLLEEVKNLGGWFGEENGYYDDSCTVSGDTVDFKSGFKWPGARRYFTVKVTNTGSITTLLKDYSDKVLEFCNDTNENDAFDADECTTDSKSLTMLYQLFDYRGFEKTGPVAFQDKSGKVFYTYSDAKEELSKFLWTDSTDSDNAYIKLEPGESMYFVTSLGVSSEVGTDNGGKMNLRASYSTKLIFNQLNKK